MSVTLEQQTIIDTMISLDNQILLTKSGAGTGKTSTSLAVVDALKPKKALYTAFNKAIVVEGAEKFTKNVECKTLHALALSFVRPTKKIEHFTYLCIKEKLSYPDKKIVIDAMDEFFRSDSVDMYTYLDTMIGRDLATITVNYIEGMIDNTVNPTFNFLLKYFHVLLSTEAIVVPYDLVILDEIQDSTAVALEIFKLLDSPKKLGLGDPEQAIYGFMNLVNGFEILSDSPVLSLTKSFRCSTQIADAIQHFVEKHVKKDFVFTGNEDAFEDGLTAYITSTNAQIVFRIHELHEEDTGYILTKSISEIFACVLALTTARNGKAVFHKKYKFLEGEYKKYTTSGMKSFFSYLKTMVDDIEIHNSIDLLMRFSKANINIFQVLKDAKATKRNPAITVGTAFSLKGLGYSTVYIEDDLNKSISDIIKKGGASTDEEFTQMKLYYVSTSRCRLHLHNAQHLRLDP